MPGVGVTLGQNGNTSHFCFLVGIVAFPFVHTPLSPSLHKTQLHKYALGYELLPNSQQLALVAFRPEQLYDEEDDEEEEENEDEDEIEEDETYA